MAGNHPSSENTQPSLRLMVNKLLLTITISHCCCEDELIIGSGIPNIVLCIYVQLVGRIRIEVVKLVRIGW